MNTTSFDWPALRRPWSHRSDSGKSEIGQRVRKARVVARSGRARASLLAGAIALTASMFVVVSSQTAALAATPPVLVGGGNHTCALLFDRSVWCWGLNTTGQLGNSGGNSTTPVKVQGLGPVLSIAAGHDDTCAIDNVHHVFCWGANAFGQLGNGTTSVGSDVPVEAKNIKASDVTTGYGHTCAVTLTGTVECWGDNNYGELGDGTLSDASTPQPVTGLTGVDEVAAGDFHTCALLATGHVSCWGSNTFGALGDGTSSDSDVPKNVVGIRDAEEIYAGSDFSCANLIGGDLKCWGDNFVGELGNGTFIGSLVPTQVAGLTSGVAFVGLGESFGCADVATPAATIVCWGNAGGYGSLGTGSFNEDDPFPTAVFGLELPPTGGGVAVPVGITAGGYQACVPLASGEAQCWGGNDWGQLGDGTRLDRAVPTAVIGLPQSAGTAYAVTGSCAITASVDASCWSLFPGNGSAAQTNTAVPVTGLPPGGVADVSADEGGCALTTAGALECWGPNADGEVGDGTTTKRPAPVAVSGMSSNVLQVSYGTGAFTCDIVANSGAFCWGYNGDGELGDGTTTEQHKPVAVTGLPVKVAEISTGFNSTCALTFGEIVECWGLNSNGELGNGSTSSSKVPVGVSGLSVGAVQVEVGDDFACALTAAGGVSCWGDNHYGQLGNGTTKDSDVPVQVSGLTSNVLSISVGLSTVCAVLQSGSVDCWGYGLDGELGNGATSNSSTPVTVSSFTSDGTSIANPVGDTPCALNYSQQVECWGFGLQGELGDGSTSASDVPVLVKGL